MKQFDSHWTDFHDFVFLNIFRKFIEETQLSLKSNKNNRYFTWRPTYICYNISLDSSWTMFQTKLYKDQNTHFLFNNIFFENHAVYEVMWNNTVEPDRPQIIWRMRTIWRITKATNIHSEYVILIASPLQQWLHERTSMLCYTYCMSLILLSLVYQCLSSLNRFLVLTLR